MFISRSRKTMILVKKGICCMAILLFLLGSIGGFAQGLAQTNSETALNSGLANEVLPQDIIRFHVIANSDSKEDQLLKYAVRDAILKMAAPRLARSASLEESRKILLALEDDMTSTAREVISDWGKEYPVSLDYGKYSFPTKSYGNIVLPAGEYEAVKIKIGRAEGANWWCILFPPLCFVNVKESTSLAVDGKAGVPLDSVKKEASGKPDGNEPDSPKTDCNKSEQNKSELKQSTVLTTYKGKKVGLFIEKFLP